MPFLTAEQRANGIADNVTQLIGETPMVWLSPKINTTKAKIALKLECENPMASVKDRLGISLVEVAEAEGKLTPGKSVLVEATSGNTGIALAQMGAIKGYKVILTMPETMSLERRTVLKLFGADVRLTPAARGIAGAIAVAKQIVADTPGAVLMSQFANPANTKIHRETTGPEVWRQTQGKVDYFFAGVGTGGTISGVGQYFKSINANVKNIAIEPLESPVLSGGKPGPHKIAGIGAGIVPEIFDRSVISEIVQVAQDDAIAMARKLPLTEGLFVGVSAGAAVSAVLKYCERPETEGKVVVVIIPSFGERYLSTVLFQTVKDEAAALPVSEVPPA